MADLITKPGVLFKKGSITELKPLMANGGKEGTFYLAEDERNLYFGTASGKIERIQGNVVFYLTLADFNNNEQPPYSEDIIYFIADNNALVRWDNNRKVDGVVSPGWVQLNTTAESVNTAIADITSAISGLQESVGKNAEDIGKNTAAIAKNTQDISGKAAQGDLQALDTRVTTAEGTIEQHTTAIGNKVDKTDFNGLQESVEELAKTLNDEGGLADQIAENTRLIGVNANAIAGKASQTDFNDLEERVDQAEQDINSKAAQTDLTALQEAVQNNAGLISTNTKNIQANAQALSEYKTENNTRFSTIETTLSNKAEANTVTTLSTKVDGISEAVAVHEQKLSEHTTSINSLITNSATKATVDGIDTRLQTAEGTIATHGNDITNLKNNSATKTELGATNEAVAENAANITKLNTAVSNKADQSALDNLTTEVGKKATASSVTELTGRVQTIEDDNVDRDKDIDSLKESVGNLQSGKVDVVAGKSLIDTTLIEKLEGIEVGANRILVDNALSSTSTNPVQNKVIDAALTEINTNIDEINESVASLDSTKANKEEVNASIKAIEDILGVNGGEGASSIGSRVTALENKDIELAAGIKKNLDDIAAQTLAIDGIEETITTLATKAELNQAKTDLTDEINNQIDAANAMTYRGTISSLDDLPNAGDIVDIAANKKLSIGDTYVVSEAFDDYNAGDLLVAAGTENEDGELTNVTWDHVETGYSTAFDQKLAVEDGDGSDSAVIHLKTYTGNLGTAVALTSANEGLTIEATNDNTITFNMVWGSFNED